MDVIGIINKEGYRREDLTEENNFIMGWLDHLYESIDGFEADYETETEDTTLLEKIKNEIAIETIEELKRYLQGTIAEIQISLIENQPEEDESNV